MNVLTNPEFKPGSLVMQLALSTFDERFELSFWVDILFPQIFTARLIEGDNSAEIWSARAKCTFKTNRVEDLHEGLRAFMFSVFPELMLRGFILEGSYKYDGKTWEVNPLNDYIEGIELPVDFDI